MRGAEKGGRTKGIRKGRRPLTTQPTNSGAFTEVLASCCANCVKNPSPQQWTLFKVYWACGPTGWLALLLMMAGNLRYLP